MRNKFEFLTRESIKSKTKTKAFLIINIVLFLVIVGLVNLRGLIKLFGGDFDKLVNIYVVDEVGMYEDFESIMSNSFFDALESYNAKVSLSSESLDELKDKIINDESKDIIVYVNRIGELTYENVFNAEIISFDYIDSILYQSITSALNASKRSIALTLANIPQELLNSIDKEILVERTILNPDLNENDELLELLGALVTIIFILPIFMLIITVVQMIGAEINEEKSSKGMEVIISSVSPEVHFLSKLVSSNLFALLQGVLIVVYILIGSGIKICTTGPIKMDGFIDTFSNITEANVNTPEIVEMINDNNVIPRVKAGLPVIVILIIFTFIAYTLFIGILASITTSMEDFNQIQTPVMMFLMAGYLLAIYAAIFQGSDFLNIMSYVPLVSGMLAPVMYILGEITLTTLVIDIVIVFALIMLLYKYGLKVYKVGILNYSSTNLWKKIFNALKN